MAVLGRACLIIAFAVTLYGIGAAIYGAHAGRRKWADSARRAVYALAVLLTGAFVILEIAFITSNFSFAIVASHSSTTTPVLYRAAAAWSSQQGSLLLWAWLLSLWSSLVLYLTRNRLREITPWATAVLMGFASFFVGLVVFLESPFATLPVAPAEGVGLNPLLRYPSMMIHPPMLYTGYTLCAVPFAFAVGGADRAPRRRRVDRAPRAASRWPRWLFLGHRDPARRALVLRRARLGRLLGLGSGRERVADAVADRHRVHPLDHDPGEARDAADLERVAVPGHRHAGDRRHVPGPLRGPRLDPRVRRAGQRDRRGRSSR